MRGKNVENKSRNRALNYDVESVTHTNPEQNIEKTEKSNPLSSNLRSSTPNDVPTLIHKELNVSLINPLNIANPTDESFDIDGNLEIPMKMNVNIFVY